VSYVTESAMKKITDAFGQRLQESGVTRIQWIALYYLGDDKKLSQRELGQLMNVKDSSVGRLMDRMTRDGLVERVPSEKDRRVHNIQLTEKGRTYREELMPLGQNFNDALIKNISIEELLTFDRVLRQMVENIENSDV